MSSLIMWVKEYIEVPKAPRLAAQCALACMYYTMDRSMQCCSYYTIGVVSLVVCWFAGGEATSGVKKFFIFLLESREWYSNEDLC